jgi:NAD(P)H-dependent FMN reductase
VSETSRKILLIIGHVPSPNTQAMRDYVEAGARSPEVEGVTVIVRSPFEAMPEDVIMADGLILGTTENLGYMSGALKDFFDRCYYPCLEECQGKPFAAYIRAGIDGTGTCRAIESITGGLAWRAVQEPLLCKGDFDDKFLDDCFDLGMAMAAGLESGIF